MAFIGYKPLCDFNTAPTAEQIGLNVMLLESFYSAAFRFIVCYMRSRHPLAIGEGALPHF